MEVKTCGDVLLTSESKEKEESVIANERSNKISGNGQAVLDESNLAGRHREGLKMLKQKQWKMTIKALTEAIAIKPGDASLYTHRALAFMRLRSYENAEADCTKALDLNGNFIKAFMRRSKSRKLQSKYILAALDLVKVMDLQHEFELQMSVTRGEYDDLVFLAIDEFERSKRAGLFSLWARSEELSRKEEYFGERFVYEQRWNDAIVKLTNAIKLSSGRKNARLRDLLHLRGNCWKKLDKLNLAEADYTSAISIDDKNITLYSKRSEIRSEMGNSSGALEDLARMVVLNPNPVSLSQLFTRYLMACQIHQQGQPLASAAKEEWETQERLAMEERRKKLGKSSELCGGVLLIPGFINPTDLMNEDFEDNWDEMEPSTSDSPNSKNSYKNQITEDLDNVYSFDDVPFVFRHKDFDEEVGSISTTDDENEDDADPIHQECLPCELTQLEGDKLQ